MTTNGFVADPVLWQTSTFSPPVPAFAEAPAVPDADAVAAAETADDCEGFDLTFAFALTFVFAFVFALAPADAGFDFGSAPLFWPGALAEFPGELGAAFFCWPGAFSEFPLPGFPATAAPVNPAMQSTMSARTLQIPRRFGLTIRVSL
ncbi:MAG TPA: hypothetical protein VF101_13450 [Gaiellaceae bacterium]